MGSGQGGARVESSQHKPGNSHYAVGQVGWRELGVLGRVLGRRRLWGAETLTEACRGWVGCRQQHLFGVVSALHEGKVVKRTEHSGPRPDLYCECPLLTWRDSGV